MFEKFDPRKGKRFQLLNEDGILSAEARKYPMMTDDELLHAFKTMILAREADDWAVSLNRQGRMPTYPPVKGQEANSIGSIMALRQDDWFVQAFRELGGLLIRGVPLSQHYLYFLGNEWGSHYDIDRFHITPISVPIGSQMPHAVGLAYAERYKGNDRVTIAFIGDGGTSTGDFHEAMNFAGVWNSSLIFYVQNNQYAISVQRKKQTASPTIAEKAFAYGFEGVQIDGNDLFAVYAATKLAAEKARKNKGPTLIEGFTYRMGAHTTADDPSRYRDEEEVQQWAQKDPLLRIQKYLIKNKLIQSGEIETLRKEARKTARDAFEEAENYSDESLDNIYRYTFKDMPPILEEQLEKRRILEGEED